MSLSNEIAQEQTLEQLREALKRSQQQYAKLKVKNDELVQAVLLEAGSEICFIPFVPGYSTTGTLKKAAEKGA